MRLIGPSQFLFHFLLPAIVLPAFYHSIFIDRSIFSNKKLTKPKYFFNTHLGYPLDFIFVFHRHVKENDAQGMAIMARFKTHNST